MELSNEDLMLIRRALEIFEDRVSRLHKGSTHEPLRALYRKDLNAIEDLRVKIAEAV